MDPLLHAALTHVDYSGCLIASSLLEIGTGQCKSEESVKSARKSTEVAVNPRTRILASQPELGQFGNSSSRTYWAKISVVIQIENDYSAQVDVYQAFGPVTGFATLGYSILGSSSAIPLDNVFYASIGAGYKFDDNLGGGLILDLRQATSNFSGERRELTGYVNYKLDRDWKVQGYLLQGFADGSPDFGLGALVTRMF